MSVASVDYGNLENENLPINYVKRCVNDHKNNSGSQDIFSDDDHVGDISCNSPRVSVKNDTFNSSVISIKTPTLCARTNEVTPGRAYVPRTPVDLLPHIKKTSFLWTSDMETPQSKINDQSRICDKTFNSIDSINKTPTRPKTPPQQNMEINPKDVKSPVLGGKKRSKRKAKRKILNNLNLDLDNSNDQQSTTGSDKAPSQTTSSTSDEIVLDINKEVEDCAIRESNILNGLDCKENKLLEEVVNTDKNSNTSTQEFFCNASFSNIDKLCVDVKEEIVKPEFHSNQMQESPKQVNIENKENNLSKNISNDILERVATIKKNQKPIRRSTDIGNTVIPEEVFSKSVMELELADVKFSQEKKPIINKAKPLSLMPFSKFSSLNSDLENESSNVGKRDLNSVANNAPEKAIVSKNVNKGEQSKKVQCATSSGCTVNNKTIGVNSANTVIKKSVKVVSTDKSIDRFSTAKGKDVAINQEKLSNFEKIYQELEKALPDEVDLKQKKEQSEKLSAVLRRHSLKEDKKTEPSNLRHDIKFEELSVIKLSPQNMNNPDDGFSTARGGGISISKEKEYQYLKIYNELSDDVNFPAATKSNTVKPNIQPINQRPKLGGINIKPLTSRIITSKDNAKLSTSKSSSNDFSTAGGGGITISKEKEDLYTNIYNQLSDSDDFDTAKKSNVKSSTSRKITSSDKVKSSTSSTSSNNGFSTARGEGISISKDKEDMYTNIYNQLSDDVDLGNAKKSNAKPSTSRTTNSYDNVKPSTNTSSDDGFSTARGGGISISKEKEDLYTNVYNQLRDDVDFGTTKKSMKSAVNQPVKINTIKEPENTNSKTSTDGFSTARGGGIAISNEKENEYLQIYNDLDDVDENSLLKIKTNKQSKGGLISKPKNKVILQFNAKNTSVPSIKGIIEKPATKSSNDGFSTAKGIDIAISNDKEKYYLNIYNELSDEVPGESSKNKSDEKPKSIKIETVDVKKETENVNEVLEEIGDLDEFFSPPHQSNTPESIETTNNFVVPNSSNILKPIYATTVPHRIVKKEVSDHKVVFNNDENLKSNLTNKPTKNVIGLLKRKLEDCDPKRTGRCRSFGGFPATTEGVTTAKLNKSDPHNESSGNHALNEGLSNTQCFDMHSDSWLSKVDLSSFDNSKVNSPVLKKQKKNDVVVPSSSKYDFSENCIGFSDQEQLESNRFYFAFERFLRKRNMMYNDMALDIKSGQSITITITNRTSSDRRLFLQYENETDVKKCAKELNYELVELPPPKKIECRTVEANIPLEIGKRKHVDTDSDTPLTSVKKPRVGSELQGRRLFSDEDDAGIVKQSENQPVQSMEVQEFEVEAEAEEEDLTEERMSAILLQEKIIRNKKRMKIKPIVGALLSERLANSKNRTSWSQLVGSSVPIPLSAEQIKQTHPDAKILEVSASNATCYKFLSSNVTGKKNIVSLDVGDNASLIFDKNGQAGASEFSQAFLAMPGVDPKLLPTGWVENHYKWIVWKLAALDRTRFGSTQLSTNLTPQRVMAELKYRYDREIDKAQRPALRRILEKDDVASRRMVLCISSIKETVVAEEAEKEARSVLGLPRWKVEATDGWYDIPLTIDSAMANYISTRKIKEGTKIITYGAELMECERGFFPLEKPPNVSLKIHTNCTRRAKWDTKMGYQRISRPMPVKLIDIISGGGMVGEIRAAAARVYPVMYREKTANGKSIYRNAKCEEKAAVAHERAVEAKIDAMYAEAQKNFDSKKKTESDEYCDSSQISQKFNNYERKQEEFKRNLELQVRQGLPPRRDVTTVLKVRLVDDSSTVILSIWGAGEDSDCSIREGDTVSIYNALESGHRGGELHLTAGRITHIKTEPSIKLPYPSRICTLIPDIGIAGFEPKFGEFDTVGIVVSSGSAPYGMKNFEMVNIAYPKPDDSGSSYLSVLFWNGVSSFGYQGMFTPGSFVACSNLEWRRNLWSIAVAYCSEKSVFTGNPRQAHLMKALRNLKTLIKNPVPYAESCVDEVAAELAKKPQSRLSQGTPKSWPTDRSVSFASPADNYSPGNVSLQKRLDKLSRYGSSPEISPIVLTGSSSRIKKEFTPVTIRKS